MCRRTIKLQISCDSLMHYIHERTMFLATVLQSTAIERRFAPNVRPSAAYYLAVVYNTERGGINMFPLLSLQDQSIPAL
jgi:hypothetical protein